MSEDIKMTDGEWLVDDHTIYTLKSNGTIDFWLQVSRPGYSGNHVSEYTVGIADKLSSHDKLTKQVKDLEFSLDDRDCYIADADMKNEDLTQKVAELRAALLSIKSHQEKVTPSGFEFSSVWQMADKALKESE